MVKKAKCRKCIHCMYENYDSYTIGCKMFGECREKYTCIHFMTELEYKTALESLKLLEEIEKYGRK
jgi:hypothetical protein